MSDKHTPGVGAAAVLTLRGERFQTPRLPAIFTAARSRSAEIAEQHDRFLPPGFLIPRQTIALGGLGVQQRGSEVKAAAPMALDVAIGELVVLELAEGGLLITRGESVQGRSLTEAPQNGGVSRGVLADWVGAQISRIYTVELGALPADDPVVADLGDKVEEWLIDQVGTPLARKGVAGVVWAIERSLQGLCGLRRWHRDVGLYNWPLVGDELARQLPKADERQPLLVFVHDLASDTLASFGALQGSDTLGALERQFPGGVYGFEHPTLSCSPVANAIALAEALPQGGHLSLVTLGRGGLVGDLLCLTEVRSTEHLPDAQRAELDRLGAVLRQKKLVVQRYLRVASPSNGTTLLGESLDLFLSGVLSVVGLAAKADPLAETLYSAFQRVVLEMVRLRADASAIPGLADLVPDAPLARFLREAPVCKGLQMAVIAGDTDGQGGWLRRIGLWLLDKVLIGSPYHDLVVDTPSMLAGIAAKVEPPVRVRLDARPEVSHFRYFQHPPHVRALRDWLCEKELATLPGFDTRDAVLARLVPPGQPVVEKDDTATRSTASTGGVRKAPKLTRPEAARRPRSTLRRTLTVSVHAADLRFLPSVLMVGHYEQDPIAGPQAVLDRELLDGMLSQRHNLGLYPGTIGTALAVLPEGGDTQRGAVIIGLGRFDVPLTRDGLTEAVMAGVLRYLLQVSDCHGSAARGLELNTLLIGTNSASSLSAGASVEALVRGVLEANARFHDTTRQDLRVDTLRIIELYLDTAITATYALNESGRQQALRTAAAMLDTQLVSATTLQQHDGARQRLFDGAAAGGNYWPRLMVTDARRSEEGAEADTPPTPAKPTSVATRLRYLHLGQRARVETVVQQRQPGLVEQLVRKQIRDNRWNPDSGRALFHLMVPQALKDTLRHFQRLVVVVDEQTANMPWELVAADDPGRAGASPRALALCVPLVRQLVTAEYRQQLRQSTGRAALVIGNPALDGFSEHFVNEKGEPLGQPDPLDGARDEAIAVAAVLRAQGHDVTLLADEPPARAADVVIALYRQPWRILHVCAHGGFALRTVDKVELTGVLLSDGAVITAAEIEAMEMVPELVFLNCCHLGQMTAPVRAGSVQRLAASLARELIGVGVRCVVVAGWAVGDWPAQRFGEVFYEMLLGPQGLDFGHAVFEARKAAQAAAPQDITWGAYQAYGDPGWRANPQAAGGGPRQDDHFVAHDELLDKLAQLRVAATQLAKRHVATAAEQQEQWSRVEVLREHKCPDEQDWRDRPEVQAALGRTWYDLMNFKEAIPCLEDAIRGEQEKGPVPIKSVELLVNALTRRGQQLARVGQHSDAEKLVALALVWLDRLDAMAASKPGETTAERRNLRGSAYKRRADVRARLLLVTTGAAERDTVRRDLRAAIRGAIAIYEESAEKAEISEKPYPQLNALALRALECKPNEAVALTESAADAGKAAQEKVRSGKGSIWDYLMIAEAEMVAWLLAGPDPATTNIDRDRVTQAYRKVFSTHPINPAECDSVCTHLELLACLAKALGKTKLVKRLEVVQGLVKAGVKHD